MKTPLDQLYEAEGEKGLRGSMDKSVKWLRNNLEEIQNDRIGLRRKQPKAEDEKKKKDPRKARIPNKDQSSFVMARDITPGSMYLYFYDPKTKDTLPYYDRFPLIIAVSPPRGGYFTGLNLHYIRPTLRLKLLQGLQNRLSDRRYDENTKIAISYGLLRGVSRLRYFKPCFKQYIVPHVISRVKKIHPSEWEQTLLLPNESFVGLKQTAVWKISEGLM